MDLHRIAGILVLATSVTVAAMSSSSLSSFLDLPTILFVVLGSLAAGVLTTGRELTAVRQGLTTDTPSVALLTRGILAARAGRRALWTVTGLSIAIHMVQMLDAISNTPAVGQFMAAIHCAPLYACLIDVVVIARLEDKLIQRAQQIDAADAVLDAVEANKRTPASFPRARMKSPSQM